MKTSRLWLLALTTGSMMVLAVSTEKAKADIESARVPSTVANAPRFTVCSGTYALCTTATCKPVAGSKRLLSCSCTVQQGYSAGAKSCQEVLQGPPTAGDTIPSRYYPIKSMAVCSNSRRWAFCLDKKCTVDPSLSTATCTCTRKSTPKRDYVVVTDSFSASTCTIDIWSSATVQDVLQITGFLQKSQQLKPFPISIIGVEPAK
jgi:hypothetical protein